VPAVRGIPFMAGHDPRRSYHGGRPKKLVEIEEALDAEHRTVENMKEVFAQLRCLATENVITRWTDKEGNEHESNRQPNPAFMKLYLDRVLGPVSEDSSEKIRRIAQEFLDGMLEEARARRAERGP
jgi:hypothetical protein